MRFLALMAAEIALILVLIIGGMNAGFDIGADSAICATIAANSSLDEAMPEPECQTALRFATSPLGRARAAWRGTE